MTSPSWLPALVTVNGEWHEVVERLYDVFQRDFELRRPQFRGLPVWWNRTLEPGDTYGEGFWHLITQSDRDSGDRLLDPRRAERIGWVAAIIRNCDDAAVLSWDYREGSGRIRTYLWLPDDDFVVILEHRHANRGRGIAFLITAHHVSGDGTRRKLRRKYDRREA